jgi:oligopeptide transport system ATP-binding protein
MSASADRPLLEVQKLSKLFPVPGGLFDRQRFVHAVDGVSFWMRRGETLGLVGESGCGKSTLGRTVLRLVEPTLGRVLLDGKDITRMPGPELRAVRRRMQIVFQDPYSSLNPRMTVRDIVGEGITIFRLASSRADLEERVAAMLGKVGLSPEMMDRYPHEFSGGQRQRIGIARALAVGPELLVCDEPVSALDVSVQAQIVNLLEELQAELSLSLLFISHDLRVVSWVSHRIAVMYLGRIVEIGPAGEVMEKRWHPYTRALFASIPRGAGSLRPTAEQAPGRDDEPRVATEPPPVQRKRLLLAGEPPSAIDPPAGCVFHPRCPKAQKGKCDTEAPPLDRLIPTGQHRVACWFPEV